MTDRHPSQAPVQIDALKALSNRQVAVLVIGLSAVVFGFLVWLIYFKPTSAVESPFISQLPLVNAIFNSISTVLLLGGYRAIRARRYTEHSRWMLAALGSSALFLVSYIAYHAVHGDTRFLGTGAIRPLYFALLISHIALSAVSVPLILASFYLSLSNRLALHRKVSRWTFPIWLYVSVTGVLVYLFLHVWFG